MGYTGPKIKMSALNDGAMSAADRKKYNAPTYGLYGKTESAFPVPRGPGAWEELDAHVYLTLGGYEALVGIIPDVDHMIGRIKEANVQTGFNSPCGKIPFEEERHAPLGGRDRMQPRFVWVYFLKGVEDEQKINIDIRMENPDSE